MDSTQQSKSKQLRDMLNSDHIETGKALCDLNLRGYQQISKYADERCNTVISFQDAAFIKGWGFSLAKPNVLHEFQDEISAFVSGEKNNKTIESLQKLRMQQPDISNLILLQAVIITKPFLTAEEDLIDLLEHPSHMSYIGMVNKMNQGGGFIHFLNKIINLFQEKDDNFLYEPGHGITPNYEGLKSASSFVAGYHLLKLANIEYETKKFTYSSLLHGESYFHFLCAYVDWISNGNGSITKGYDFVRALTVSVEFALGERQVLGDLRKVNDY